MRRAMAQPALDGVDMSKVQFRSYTFHFLFAAAKACLLPFLTVYFRILGLSAMQVGIIVGVGFWVTMITAPCWTHCAVTCRKRRFLLVGSLFTFTACYMLLTVVPPISDQRALSFCQQGQNYSNNQTEGKQSEAAAVAVPVPTTTANNSAANYSTTATPALNTTLVSTNVSTTSTTTTTTTTTPTTTTPSPPEEPTTKNKNKHGHKVSQATVAPDTDTQDLEDIFEPDELQELVDLGVDLDTLRGMSTEEIYEYLEDVLQEETNANPDDETPVKRSKRDAAVAPTEGTILDTIWTKFSALEDQLQQLKQQLFAAVLVIILIASLFGSPVDKLCDDAWFEFLDATDMLEKYGQHKSWAAIGMILFPVLTTVVIQHSDCLLTGDRILNFKIHFFVFGALMFLCLILSCVYPIFSERKKVQRPTSIGRGVRILFGDCHSALYTLTVFLLGMFRAVPFLFLFWLVQDLGGSELVMGLAVCAAAFSQLVMQILQKSLIRKISHSGAVVLGLVVLAGRLVTYSLIASPWLIVVGECFHGLSTELIMAAVLSYPDFRLNPFVTDRSAVSVISIIHVGLGMAAGSLVSGILYGYIGLRFVLQGCCVVAVAWAILFALLQRCVQKQAKVRYAKLLQDDGSPSEDESFDENDWLEIALKHQK